MLEALSAYWVYIGIGVVVIGLLFYFVGGDSKQHIDILEENPITPRQTLGRGNNSSPPLTPPPYPYKYKAPPRSPLPRDNMLVLKGVGPMVASRLDTFNFTRYEHIAIWKREDYEDIAVMLGQPVERIIEDRWVEQCILLAAERYEEYEAEYGKIDQEAFNRFKNDIV
jgi:predicted flap endonuclease-1-like 5' DNA nuclease